MNKDKYTTEISSTAYKSPTSKFKTKLISNPKSGQLSRDGTNHPIILLDGSMGNYIRESSIPQEDGSLFSKMWAAAALVDQKYHEIVINAHVKFIESGSKIISTNSYATQPNYYSKVFGADL